MRAVFGVWKVGLEEMRVSRTAKRQGGMWCALGAVCLKPRFE